jgi:hypothetical protein
MLGLMQTDDSELNLEKIQRIYPKKALGLFRIYEWIQKENPNPILNNKLYFQSRPVFRFSEVAEWWEKVVFGIPEVE